LRLAAVTSSAGRIDGNQTSLAMLADDPSAEMLDPDLKSPTARRALLNEVGWVGHRKQISYRQPARHWVNH
jgi:hypothetical protein